MSAVAATLACVWLVHASAQSVTFDFDSAPLHASFPIFLTAGGITAHFSASPTYYNYSIQTANVLGFTPAGFAGNCIYPNQVYACDLLISFDRALSYASIMYSPEEYATDSSCTMRITAYYGSRPVGTRTYTIPLDQPGTWPTGVLSFTAMEPFNNVVIHYDKPPVTGGDYGPIFMADNLVVTPWTAPYVHLEAPSKMINGSILLHGVSVPLATVTVEATTTLTQPFTFLATVSVAGDGTFQFEDLFASLYTSRFYRVTYP
jgi:hypothetical protein